LYRILKLVETGDKERVEKTFLQLPKVKYFEGACVYSNGQKFCDYTYKLPVFIVCAKKFPGFSQWIWRTHGYPSS